MKDRALLEMAAKAAGYTKTRVDVRGWFFVCVYSGEPEEWELWNPLTDDGDALRLAVKLRLMGGEDSCLVMAMYESGDPYAATRRAIVRAAAEIGRAMP